MSHDAEMCVALEQHAFASLLRRILWAEHTVAPLPGDMPWPSGDITQANKTPGMKIAGRALALVETLVGKSGSDAGLPPTRSTPSPETAALAASLADAESGMRELARLADENLGHLHAGEPLTGHLLPYLRAAEGPAFGLNVERHRGLLDPLREIREGVVVPHYGRYI